MKNRIEKRLAALQREGKKALVAFVTAGDPHLKWTPQVVLELEKAGADVIELGMPFSDPMADGPVIQKSSERALKAGTTLKGIFQAVAKIRKTSEIPILLMGYFNPVLQYGIPEFFAAAKRAGVDGALLVDLPPEEGEEVRRAAKAEGISLVYLLSPTSGRERIDLVRRKGSGFIYYVSLTGVTGAAIRSTQSLHQKLKEVVKDSPLPVCVGFGIKTADQAAAVARDADGVVVGSALVDCFAKSPPKQAIAKVSRLVRSMSKKIH
ncbi:MAG TPA: tryptophan synthase subunit alpha [bacterium]|nr:tryptophan synthase subunit alpha [bacterium]